MSLGKRRELVVSIPSNSTIVLSAVSLLLAALLASWSFADALGKRQPEKNPLPEKEKVGKLPCKSC